MVLPGWGNRESLHFFQLYVYANIRVCVTFSEVTLHRMAAGKTLWESTEARIFKNT